MKKLVWGMIILMTLSLGIFVLEAPNEIYDDQIKEILIKKKENVVSSTAYTPTDNYFSLSLIEVVKMYQIYYPSAEISSVDLESDSGKYYFVVKGRDKNKEYGIKIHPETKKIKKRVVEYLDSKEKAKEDSSKHSIDTSQLIPLGEITKIAQKYVEKGKPIEWHLKKEESSAYWNVIFKYNENKIEVKVNAYTGEIFL
ncbi:PepSY domain-containing protein [Enterococcus faecium]|uniref:PepSY domain-containing protein n=1 Tax=Enterococcus faecium TaxID=1352 RepID=UPI00241410CD|nr:PepSY domain-containing protein [Enterococcus faecium]MDG4589159.1 PepSY domain-containing protein [Enterococcus faecium]